MDFDKNMLIWLWIFHLKVVFDMNLLLLESFSGVTYNNFNLHLELVMS